MAKRCLPRNMRRAVMNYYGEVWVHHSVHPKEAKIFSELPHFLRAKVASHITSELLSKLEVFSGLDPEITEQVASRLIPVELAPGV